MSFVSGMNDDKACWPSGSKYPNDGALGAQRKDSRYGIWDLAPALFFGTWTLQDSRIVLQALTEDVLFLVSRRLAQFLERPAHASLPQCPPP